MASNLCTVMQTGRASSAVRPASSASRLKVGAAAGLGVDGSDGLAFLIMALVRLPLSGSKSRTGGMPGHGLWPATAVLICCTGHTVSCNLGALIFRIGLWGILYSNYNKELPKALVPI